MGKKATTQRIAISGNFLLKEPAGIARYALNLVKAFDEICGDMKVEFVVSKKLKNKPIIKNIKIVSFGYGSGILWEQFWFAIYTLFYNRRPVTLASTIPLLNCSGIAIIHDIRDITRPEFILKNNLRTKMIFKWARLQFWVISKFSKNIVTVSEFSKKEISEYYNINPDRITVIPNGWQHIENIEQKPEKADYYFALSSIAKHKNFKWILEIAKRNPCQKFLIAGSLNKKYFDTADIENHGLPNVDFLGYVSDEKMQNLMRNAKAFLFPSFYEGFGIPPMEALALGTPIIVSDIPVLREVYGNSAHYINPYSYDADLERILQESVAPANDILEKFSWEKSAAKLKKLLEAC
jgi:glycosyltransferase involved in cell wall biosynthesis